MQGGRQYGRSADMQTVWTDSKTKLILEENMNKQVIAESWRLYPVTYEQETYKIKSFKREVVKES